MYKTLKKCFHDSHTDEAALYKNRFESESSIHFDFEIAGYPAFFYLAPEVYQLAVSIHQKNSSFLNYQKEIPVLQTVLTNCIFTEIQMSNEIEDIHCTRQELKEAYNSVNEGKRGGKFYGQIRQYLYLTSGKHSPFPENSEEIRNIYNLILADDVRNERPDDEVDGLIFRKGPVEVAGAMGPIHRGVMPEEEMIRILDQTIETLNSSAADPLIYAALFHFIFAYVHPFYNGNGRLARYLSVIKLAESLNLIGVLHLSLKIRQDRPKYYRSFAECENILNRGDLTPFVIQFLEFVNEAMEESLSTAENFSIKYKTALKKIHLLTSNKSERKVLETLLLSSLFGGDALTKSDLANEIHKTAVTTDKILKKYPDFIIRDKSRKTHRYYLNLDRLLSFSEV